MNIRMSKSNYLNLCEEIWQNWKDNPNYYKQDLEGLSEIKFNFCPEPFLFFKAKSENENPLYFLTYNPGSEMEFQSYQNIKDSKSVVKFEESYNNNASLLGRYYDDNLQGKRAHDRINKMYQLAERLNYDCFMQLESMPFHSEKFPSKEKYIELSNQEGNIANTYIKHLREYCLDKDIIAICAATKQQVNELNSWTKFMCDIIGLNLSESKNIVLNNSVNGPTVSCFVDTSNGNLKVLSLVKGNNNLPKIETLLNELKVFTQKNI